MRGLRKMAAVATAAAVSAVLVLPAPAWAKSDYGVTVKERRVQVGQTIHVTVSIDDDSGIDRDTTMCLYQVLSNRPPVSPGKVHGPFRKVGTCRRPAVSPAFPYSGVVRYTLKTTSSGWLTLVAFRGHGQKMDNTGPDCVCALSRVVSVRGPHGSTPKTGPARLSLVSVKP